MNKKQKEDLIVKIILWVCFLAFIMLMGSLVRFAFIEPSITYSNVCKDIYGKNWGFDGTDYFGKTCVELDYITLEITNRTLYNWTSKEIEEKYCSPPSFFNLKRWNDGCII